MSDAGVVCVGFCQTIFAVEQGAGRSRWARRVLLHSSLFLIVLLMLFSPLGQAQDNQRWVSDEFEVTMRKGKSTRQSIVRMLSSGTRIELLDTDRDAGYSLVRTRSGVERWVLSRYLLKNPPARVTLPDVEARLKQSDSRRQELEQEVRSLREERSELQRQTKQLESSGQAQQKDLDDIRRLSSSTIQVDSQNKALRQRLLENDRIVNELETENRRLSGRSSREWFVVGAGVVVFGVLLGLILPRIRWRRKSSWGDL